MYCQAGSLAGENQNLAGCVPQRGKARRSAPILADSLPVNSTWSFITKKIQLRKWNYSCCESFEASHVVVWLVLMVIHFYLQILCSVARETSTVWRVGFYLWRKLFAFEGCMNSYIVPMVYPLDSAVKPLTFRTQFI